MSCSIYESLCNPRFFLRVYFTSQCLEFKSKGRFKGSKKYKYTSSIFTTMWLDYVQQVKAYNSGAQRGQEVRGFQKDDMQLAFSEFIEQNDLKLLEMKIAEIKCEKEGLTPLIAFVQACTATEDPLIVAVLAHWLCNIKRKMLGLDAKEHIMPIFYGDEQGTGKSTAVANLLSVIEDWKEEFKLDEIADSRYGHAFQENYVLSFDEMMNADKTEIATLKNRITGKSFGCRKLGTNIIDRVEQNCSFIGTSNRPIDEQIVDSSGMRRFFQIKVAARKDWNWELINSIDYTELFKGIDENRAEPYIKPYMEQLRIAQGSMTALDAVSEFMMTFGVGDLSEGAEVISIGQIYKCYRDWCEDNGYKPTNSSWLGKHLKNRGIEETRTARSRCYVVGAKAAKSFEKYSDPMRGVQ
jgi:hypothetical protein